MRKILRRLYKIWGDLMAFGLHLYYNNWCNKIMKIQNLPNKKVEGEDEYMRKWKQLSRSVNPKYYRIFSNYIKPDSNIVPEDICHNVIEHILNPAKHRVFYADKNMYDKLFPSGTLPTTILRCIQGVFYSSDYKALNESEVEKIIKGLSFQSLILKPSTDSDSGHGVVLFKKEGDGYKSNENFQLTYDFLLASGSNWILQECLEQHACMSLFNDSSVNTLRVLVYRSPIDNKSRVLNHIMRIGKRGAYVDNVHAGGLSVGVTDNGILGNFLCDQYGNRYKDFNGLNFSNTRHEIPHFDNIVKFAELIADKILHLRLLALDIMIDKEGKPRLIEFNVYALGTWVFQFTNSSVFGERTDEIIAYCKQHKSQIERVRVSVW